MNYLYLLKQENVHLDEQYFDVLASKTENDIRKVPIADKVLPFYRAWMERNPNRQYLLHNPAGDHFKYVEMNLTERECIYAIPDPSLTRQMSLLQSRNCTFLFHNFLT